MHLPSLPRRRHAALLLQLALTSPILLLQGCDNIPSTIKIGVAQPLSGDLAPLGQDMLNGVFLAVEELNKEGFRINGKPVTIEVVAEDDHANAESGKVAAKSLVDAGVVAVIGHLNSSVSIAAAPIYAEKHIAELAISTNPKFTQLGFDTTFRLVANDTLQATAMGGFATTQFNATQYAVVDDGTLYGKELAAGAAAQLKKAKKNIVFQLTLDDKTTQFDELASKLKTEKIEVLLTTLSDFQVVALIDALKKVNYTQIRLLGGDTVKTPETLTRFGILEGLYVSSPLVSAQEFKSSGNLFLSKYKAKFKTEPVYGGHYSYDAMYVLAAAIRRSESASPEKITATLHKIGGYAPVTGSMRWNDKGELDYAPVAIFRAYNTAWEQIIRSSAW